MAFTLSRIDRKSRTYQLAATVLAEAAAIPPDLTGVDVALLPPRSAPSATTVWYSAQYNAADGSFTVLLAGPDADSTGALTVPTSADIWMRIADSPEVDAEKLERITVLGGGAVLAVPAGVPVVSVNGKTGSTVVLTAADVGAAPAGTTTPADASTTVKGVVELATTGETQTGTDTVRAVTPAGVKAVVGGLAPVPVTTAWYEAAGTVDASGFTAPISIVWQLAGNLVLTGIPQGRGTSGTTMTFCLRQAASGGPYTVTWPASLRWVGEGSAPTMPTAAGAELFVEMFWTGEAWRAAVIDPPSGNKTTLYVSTSGNNANSGRTPTAAKATIAAALAALPAGAGDVRVAPGSYTLSSGFTVDASLQRVIGAPGVILNAASMTSGTVVSVTGSVNPPYRQAYRVLDHLEIVGSGSTNSVTGVAFTTPVSSGNGASHIQATNLNVHGFGTGLSFGDRSYCIDVAGSDVWNCGVCVDMPTGVTDGGERVSLTDCTIFNSTLGVRARNQIGELFLFNCSLDYNAKQVEVASSVVNLIGCHVESNAADTGRWFSLTGDGCTLQMVGGRLVANGAPGGGQADYLVENNAAGMGGAFFSGVMMNNVQTTSRDFSTGTGHTAVRDTTSTDISALPLSVGATANLLADGSFEATAVTDPWFVQADTATVTDPLAGTNLTIATSATTARTGARSLAVTKVGAAGTTASAALLVPIRRGSIPRFRSYWSKPGAHTGSFTLFMHFAAIRTGGVTPLITRIQEIGESTMNLSSSPLSWLNFQMGEPTYRAPAWATHFLFLANMTAMNAGTVYFDDLSFTEM